MTHQRLAMSHMSLNADELAVSIDTGRISSGLSVR